MLPDKADGNSAVARATRASSRGFTLLEIVVALAIMGLALVGLFRAGSGGVLAVDTAGHVDQAIERAQSRLAAIGRGRAIGSGQTEGDDGGGYHWQVRARPPAARQGGSGAAPTTITFFQS